MTERPTESEFAPFYAGYVALVPETDVMTALEDQPRVLSRLAAAVPADKQAFRYAPGKWSVREIFSHLTDAERVFGHRAFCVSRGERAALPGFDENDYVANAPFGEIGLEELAAEFALVRQGNLAVLRRLDVPRWNRVGTANGAAVSISTV